MAFPTILIRNITIQPTTPKAPLRSNLLLICYLYVNSSMQADKPWGRFSFFTLLGNRPTRPDPGKSPACISTSLVPPMAGLSPLGNPHVRSRIVCGGKSQLPGTPAIRGIGKERFAGLWSMPLPQMVYSAPVFFGFRAVIEQGTDPEPETVVEPARVPALVSAGTRDLLEKKSR